MQKININFDQESLYDLLKNYYELSKIKTAIFDDRGYKILTYPENDCEFCTLMKSHERTRKLCKESDRASFEIVKREKKLIIYHCHAGLVEASAPLIQDGNVIGYMMFGQITDEQNKEKFLKHIDTLLSTFDIELKNKEKYSKIKYRSENQIKAAAKLLETCTFYVLLKDYVRLSQENFLGKLNNYIEQNIENDISITDLTDYFNISKNRLYEQFNEYKSIGIAEYIKLKRIDKAKELLIKTDLKITEISEKVGFIDYNYFCRSFKKIVGIPAKKYRKNH